MVSKASYLPAYSLSLRLCLSLSLFLSLFLCFSLLSLSYSAAVSLSLSPFSLTLIWLTRLTWCLKPVTYLLTLFLSLSLSVSLSLCLLLWVGPMYLSWRSLWHRDMMWHLAALVNLPCASSADILWYKMFLFNTQQRVCTPEWLEREEAIRDWQGSHWPLWRKTPLFNTQQRVHAEEIRERGSYIEDRLGNHSVTYGKYSCSAHLSSCT